MAVILELPFFLHLTPVVYTHSETVYETETRKLDENTMHELHYSLDVVLLLLCERVFSTKVMEFLRDMVPGEYLLKI